MMRPLQDAIDFKSDSIAKLFQQYLYPTLLGMVFSSAFIITDGIFIGKGIGSHALAAVNLAAPIYLLCTGIGLMFGMGGSVIASIHLARKKQKSANIIATQAIVIPALFMLLLCIAMTAGISFLTALMGTPAELESLVKQYLLFLIPFFPFNMLFNVAMFMVRINGFPKAVMRCTIVASLLNIFLDYLFIFPFGWGLPGAAVATGIGISVGTLLLCRNLWIKPHLICMIRPKWSLRSGLLTARNMGYMMRIGFPALLGDLSLAAMIYVGNLSFAQYIGTEGIAAFSVVCYLCPLIFMAYNAIVQAAQPILSFNYGCGAWERVAKTFRFSLLTALGFGLLFLLLFLLFRSFVVALFLSKESLAFTLASQGLILFSLGFPFFGLNMAWIGYYQSIEKASRAALFMLLRGILLMTAAFYLLPLIWSEKGIWLAVPAAEVTTLLLLILSGIGSGRNNRRK